MSSTNKTALGLNMWEASDKPVRQDFVNDNVIIDEKITQLNSNLNNRGVVTQIAVITATGATTVPNMSAYKYIYACGMQGTNNAVCSVFAPYSVFKGDALLYASFYDGSTVRQFPIRATNDTTVNIGVITNCSNGVTIYGIK